MLFASATLGGRSRAGGQVTTYGELAFEKDHQAQLVL